MPHVRITLDIHQIAHLYRSVFADAAEVVAAEVDEHYVFSSFLLVFPHFFFEGGVGGFVFSARMRACDRTVLGFRAANPNPHFWRRSESAYCARPGFLFASFRLPAALFSP